MQGINYILINKRGKILLQKRDDVDFIRCPGEWAIPGGGIEEGEKIIDTAVREVVEETGIKVKTVDFLCDHEYTWGDKNRVFIMTGSGKVNSSEGRMEWKTLKEIKSMELADNQSDIIKIFEKR